jgi:hypothetical protein
MRREDELVVITKTYDLILWSCNHTSHSPRSHRFVLGVRVERGLYELLETLIRAKYTRQRQALLEEANLRLEILRFQMRLARDLQCLLYPESWPGYDTGIPPTFLPGARPCQHQSCESWRC